MLIAAERQPALNTTARGLLRVDWWGEGGDLVSSDHPFAIGMREEFREIKNEEVNSAPIRDAGMAEWEEDYLATYVEC